ncbi:MAG TPA: glycosyltransferase family 39 protein [Patescibacteria group bacterium]
MKPQPPESRKLLLIIILLSAGISIFSLYRLSIRLDEAQSIWMSTKSIAALLKITAEDVNLPLYGAILHFWMQFWGTRIEMVRTLSLIFFIATLPVLYSMAEESSNKTMALLTVALFSFSPFIIWYTSEARTYTLFALISSLNHLFFLRYLRSKGDSGKLGYFLSTVAGLYTHYFFLFFLASQALYATISIIRKKERRYLWGYYGIMLAAFACFSPWIYYVVKEGTASNTQPLIPPPTSFNIIQAIVNFIFGFQSLPLQSALISLWPISLILLFFALTQKDKLGTKNLGYFFIMTFLPIAMVFTASYVRPIFLSRYLILATPSLFLLIAWMLLNHPRKISFYLSSLSLVIMFGLLLFQNISASTPVKEDYRGATKYLESHAGPQDVVAISAPFTIYPIEYQYHGTAKLETIPLWDRYVYGPIPVYSREKLVSQINAYRQQYQDVFVVLSYDQGYESDIKDYLDHNLERLSLEKFSETIEVREYKLRYN